MLNFLLYFSSVSILYLKPIRCNFQLQILHCNDLHARFMETDTYCSSCPEKYIKNNKCFGGFARLKEAAIEATEEAKKRNLPSIFLNAGDTFQGTPFYTLYKWKICAELIAKMGFDVMTLGNHEFDDGIENLVNFLKNANTPTICTNLDFDSEPRLKMPSLTTSYVKTINDKKIGFIGYLTPDTMISSSTENLKIHPEVSRVRSEAAKLKSVGIDIIIALGHSGINTDLKIAEEIEELSLVVGGHSHTLMYTPPDKPPSTESVEYSYPTWVSQKSGKKVPVVHAYACSKYLGKLLVEFDNDGDVLSATGNPILLDASIKKEPIMTEAISVWTNNLMDKLRTVEGYTRTFLGIPNFSEGIFECTLGNFITDALIDLGVKYSAKNNIEMWTKGPIALYQNGGIRTQINHKKNKGALTTEDIMMIAPFDNKVKLITLRGTTIKKVLENNVATYTPENPNVVYHYVHFSGMRVAYDLNRPKGNRVKSVEVVCTQCNTPEFVTLEDETAYQVFTISFLADGGNRYEIIAKEKLNSTTLEWNDFECLSMYVQKNTHIYPKIDNRVVVEGFRSNRKVSRSFGNSIDASNLILMLSISLIYLITKTNDFNVR